MPEGMRDTFAILIACQLVRIPTQRGVYINTASTVSSFSIGVIGWAEDEEPALGASPSSTAAAGGTSSPNPIRVTHCGSA